MAKLEKFPIIQYLSIYIYINAKIGAISQLRTTNTTDTFDTNSNLRK